MVLVDTTVWIDFFAARQTPQTDALDDLIETDADLCVCGVILTEVLQGIRFDKHFRETKAYFDDLIFLPMGRETFVRAADIYRTLRKRGITLRKPVDGMIAAVAIENDTALLHNDRDFDPIAEFCGLMVVAPQTAPRTSAENAAVPERTNMPEPSSVLLELCPDFPEWPERWMGIEEDRVYGTDLLAAMLPFAEALAASGLTRKTIRRHLDNLWLMGGEIIRVVGIFEEYAIPAAQKLMDSVDAEGGPSCRHLDSEDAAQSYDRTCRKLHKFLQSSGG